MKKKTSAVNVARNRKSKSAKQTKENSTSSMLDGIFSGSTLSTSSQPFQLGAATQYNPITLNRVLLSYAYMTFGIIQTFIDQPVEDCFRGGVDIECDELNEDDIKLLQDVLIELKDYDAIKNTMKWAKLFGGAGLIINTDQDPTEELDIEAIGENTPLAFIDADRWELVLSYIVEEKIPTPYNYYGQPIHKSRVLKVMGKEAPSFIRKRLQGWGMSELERVMRDFNAYTKNQDVIYELLDEAKQDVWMLDGFNTKLATAQGNKLVQDRLALANQLKNFSNAIMMDKNDLYDQKQITFSGLADIQNQNRIGVAAAIRMPMTKLFGMSASGFNSGEDDIENYNSLIESEVRAKAREPMHTIIKLRCQQLFGFIPEHFEVKFKPLRILSAEQEENIKDKKFNRASAQYAQGMFTPQEYAEQLRKDNITEMETEVGRGVRDAEPPQPSMDVDIPQKIVKPKAEIGRN